MLETNLHVISAIVICLAAIVPIYLSKIKKQYKEINTDTYDFYTEKKWNKDD
jgi:hypothetical protein